MPHSPFHFSPGERLSRQLFLNTRETVLEELRGRLWHTTHPDRFKSILADGSILPEPNLANTERWKTSRGPHYYPYVRSIGGVSLFDFEGFDPENYSSKNPMSSWYAFVPYPKDWGTAIWIEIDRERIAGPLISGTDLVARWKSDAAHRHTIMPHIEAAHIGALPRDAFIRAFLVREADSVCHPVNLNTGLVVTP
jgi:hypothetical protein